MTFKLIRQLHIPHGIVDGSGTGSDLEHPNLDISKLPPTHFLFYFFMFYFILFYFNWISIIFLLRFCLTFKLIFVLSCFSLFCNFS